MQFATLVPGNGQGVEIPIDGSLHRLLRTVNELSRYVVKYDVCSRIHRRFGDEHHDEL
jgi:hypothetical protein